MKLENGQKDGGEMEKAQGEKKTPGKAGITAGAFMVIFRYMMLYENMSYTTTIRSFHMCALFSLMKSKKKQSQASVC